MSQQQGFPPITQEPLETGGKAPQRDDFNGAFNLLSEHTVHLQAGGQYLYNPALTYNLGNIIALDDGLTLVQSLIDDNLDNPNVGLGLTWRATDAAELNRAWARRYAGAGIVVGVNTVLSAAQVGSWVSIEAVVVTTLPAIADVPVGSTFVLRNMSSASGATVNSLGGNVGGVINFSLAPNEIVELSADPSKGWWVTSRSQAVTAATSVPIGIPLPYPLSVPPSGFLLMVGQAFNPALFPLLALVYPANVLPDMRGELVRGWDNGRGVDPSRGLLSPQAGMLENHLHGLPAGSNDSTGTGWNQASPGNSGGANTPSYFYNSLPTGGTETRPRNLAFNFICRAV
ncbi:phage tail protein [Pseudomonas sp. NPDC086251]|uniref:phage tail protein n=1 Tax=Pseudomonas sp. NPDC086251 TaxID=3364431 RepID=UPI00383719CD